MSSAVVERHHDRIGQRVRLAGEDEAGGLFVSSEPLFGLDGACGAIENLCFTDATSACAAAVLERNAMRASGLEQGLLGLAVEAFRVEKSYFWHEKQKLTAVGKG